MVDVNNDANEIEGAVKSQMRHGRYDPDFVFGDGHTAEKVVAVLEGFEAKAQKQNSF